MNLNSARDEFEDRIDELKERQEEQEKTSYDKFEELYEQNENLKLGYEEKVTQLRSQQHE